MSGARPRSRNLWLVGLAVIVITGCVMAAESERTVVVMPGQNIQEIVENSPQGTQFRFEPGIYRQQTIYPKNRQGFIGQNGVIFSGAIELTTWRNEAGLWHTGGLPAPLPAYGGCAEDRPLCDLREDLFVSDRLYQRVGSIDDLRPGKWYYESGRAYLADDPTGWVVELGITPFAIGGGAEDVVLKDLIVEKYATLAQYGAIDISDGRRWVVSGVTARWNHGAGLATGPGVRVKGGSFSYNGQLGIGGLGQDLRIEGVEIAFNNYAGYSASWEAGGTKFWATKGLTVRDSCIHNNAGPGLWTDNDNIDVLYERNKIFLNADDGIRHEISYDAIIRNNVLVGNGTSGFDVWLWGSQILIQNSSNVQVYHNLVEVSSEFGNGIGVIHQDRGDGAYGPWRAVNNSIHDNTIVHLGGGGQNGVVTDTYDDRFWNDDGNMFNWNTYIVADRTGEYWTSNDRNAAWDSVEDLGFEANGTLTVEQRAPTELACER